jgi:leucyl aminopeptidase
MNIIVRNGEALYQDTPLLVLGAWEGEALPAAVAALHEDGDWSGKYKRTLLLYPRGALPPRRLLLVGLGKRGAFEASRLREVAAVAAQRARELKLDRYSFDLPTPRSWAKRPRLSASAPAYR